eukprot:gene3580-7119_t
MPLEVELVLSSYQFAIILIISYTSATSKSKRLHHSIFLLQSTINKGAIDRHYLFLSYIKTAQSNNLRSNVFVSFKKYIDICLGAAVKNWKISSKRAIRDFRITIATFLLKLAKKLIGINGIREIGRNYVTPSKLNHTQEVYVLELEDNCWYVGSTTDIASRWVEHLSGKGSMWTQIHHPKRLISVEQVSSEDVAGREMKRTAELMLRHGINNVRGAMFCKTEAFITENITVLTGCIGHSLTLNYGILEKTILKQMETIPLPLITSKKTKMTKSKYNNNNNLYKNDFNNLFQTNQIQIYKCNRCGRNNHIDDDCFAKNHLNGTILEDFITTNTTNARKKSFKEICIRCGKKGHNEKDCYSRTHASGGGVT